MGTKDLGDLNPSRAKDLSRDDLESNLNFAGFVVISCPLKSDSKSVIKELIHASHHVVMITGREGEQEVSCCTSCQTGSDNHSRQRLIGQNTER